MNIDETEFRTFIANVEEIVNNCGVYRDKTVKAMGESKFQIEKYKQLLENQPITSKWKQLKLIDNGSDNNS